MKHRIPVLVLVSLLSTVSGPYPSGRCAEMKSGPHGGQIAGEGQTQVEVKVNSPGHAIDAYVLRNPGEPPSSLLVTFFDKAEGKRTTIELQALKDPNQESTRFHGMLNTWSGSYIGFEVRIPLERGKETILHSQ